MKKSNSDVNGDEFFSDTLTSITDLGYEVKPKKKITRKKKEIKKKLKSHEVNADINIDDYLPDKPIDNNPFKVGDKVLFIEKNDRYDAVINFNYLEAGNISSVTDDNFVDVGFWDTDPAVIKKVPITHLELVSKAPTKEVTQPTKKVVELKSGAKSDASIKPSRYNQGSMEVWDVYTGLQLGPLESNVLKYISRYKHKNGVDDLKKALTYLIKLISIENDQDYYELVSRTVKEVVESE